MMTRADWGVVLASLCLIGAGFAFIWQPGQAGTVDIAVNGQVVERHSLWHEQLRHVQGRRGESVIEIGNGRARFVSSPCDNKLCVRTGWLQQTGELAACLPNGVSIHLAGDDNVFDSMSF